MQIVGTGLIARSLQPFASLHDDTVAFASGVSDSSCTSWRPYEREFALLHQVINMAKAQGKRIVYFSGGGAIYGRWTRAAIESDRPEPRSPYGRHQLICERIVTGAGVPYVVARLPNVVGPVANPHQLVPSLVRQALSGTVRVQVDAERDLIDVRDVGGIISMLLERVSQPVTVNVASGHSVAVATIVAEICQILMVSPTIAPEPEGDRQRFATDRLKELLKYDPFPDPGYFREILRAHVPSLAKEARDAADFPA